MNWQDTPLIDSTPRDVDEELRDILQYYFTGDVSEPSVAINNALEEIKKLFKVNGDS